MKAKCPICGNLGILEVRGNSQRIIHYKRYTDGKRVYEKHTIMGINGNKFTGINTHKTRPKLESEVRGVGFEPTNPFGIGASVLRL